MEIITGYTGKAHIFSEQDRDVNIGIVGEGSYVLQTGMQLEAEVSSNNEIKIRDGVLMHQGCTASIKKNTYDSLTIINGSQGMKRIDLIVARYERNQDNGTESISLKVIQGTPEESNPAVPSHITGDIQSGDAVADMPMYKIIIDGLNITEVQKVYSEAPNITELNRNFKESVYADGYMVVDIGALPNNSTKSVPANIPSAASEYWISDAWCKSRTTGQVSPMPYIDASTWSNAIGITISASKNIVVTTKADWSAYSGKAVIAYKLSFI